MTNHDGFSRRQLELCRLVADLEPGGRGYERLNRRACGRPYLEIPALEPRRNGLDARPTNERNIADGVDYLHTREDCRDFGAAALLRILYRYPVQIDRELRRRIVEGLLGSNYWLDEPGSAEDVLLHGEPPDYPPLH